MRILYSLAYAAFLGGTGAGCIFNVELAGLRRAGSNNIAFPRGIRIMSCKPYIVCKSYIVSHIDLSQICHKVPRTIRMIWTYFLYQKPKLYVK